DIDAVLAGQLEYPWQALGTVALEGIRTGARLVRAHTRAALTVIAQCGHHGLDIVAVVDGAEPREYVQRILIEAQPPVVEAADAPVVAMAAEYAVLLRNAHRALDAGQRFQLLLIQCLGIADQINLGEHLLLPLHQMLFDADAGELVEEVQRGAVGLAAFSDVGMQNQQHANLLMVPWHHARRRCRAMATDAVFWRQSAPVGYAAPAPGDRCRAGVRSQARSAPDLPHAAPAPRHRARARYGAAEESIRGRQTSRSPGAPVP